MSPSRPSDVPEPFRIDIEPHRATVAAIAHGEIDLVSAPELATQLGELLGTGFARIVLDLRDVPFIDSSGLRVILDTDAACGRRGVEFAMVPGPTSVQRLFQLTGTDAQLQFVEDHGDV
jgi:anti-anti-sigma factor